VGRLRSRQATAASLVAAVLVLCGKAGSQTSDLTPAQLNHRAYTASDGAPSEIDALAQTTDGTLWIGSRGGLTRFDGVRFRPYPSPGEESLLATNVATLLAAPDGGLWIGMRPGGVRFLKDGHVTRYGNRDGLPAGTVQQFAFDRDGSLWTATRSGLGHFNGKRWDLVTDDSGFTRPFGVLVDRVGTLWVATANGLFARAAGEPRFQAIDARAYSDPHGGLLAAAPDGTVWAIANHELAAGRVTPGAAPATLISLAGIAGPMLVDATGNLWAADTDRALLHHLNSGDLAREDPQHSDDAPLKLGSSDDTIPENVWALLEDREHNIWVGTDSSLHRFSRSNVVGSVMPNCPRSTYEPVFVAGDAGTVWVVCDSESVGHLYEIRAGAVISRQITPQFSVAYRDSEGTLWFGGPTEFGYLENGRIVGTPMPVQLRGSYMLALVRDRQGAMWVSLNRGGLFRVVNGEWSAYGALDSLPRAMAYVEAADKNGDLWLGYAGSQVARVSGRAVQLFDEKQGLSVGNVLEIYAGDGELWVGGELGVARFDGAHFVGVRSATQTPLTGVSGIVRARNGDLWLNGVGGIAHITRQEIAHVIRDPTYRVHGEVFDHLDGVPGIPFQLQSRPSIVEASEGRLWFLMSGGIVYIDPTHLAHNPLPPPVRIGSLLSGGESFADVRGNLSLPANTTDLQIEYGAGSLTIPERVNFRYKLEGSDRDWQNVGAQREARYTNLGPGQYTFRVTASNNDGVWNTTGASLQFSISPAFYQTKWFYALCALAAVLVLAALYRVRMHQVAAQVRGRLEARLAERERIARDLHDTLLQSIQGLIWRFQAATDRLPPSEPARQLLEQSLDRADEVLAESRDKVKELRPAGHDAFDLAQALAVEVERLAQTHPVQCQVNVQGNRRDLHPMVREEGFLIAREALSNAFRHANAATVEAEIAYGERALQVRIRDDGQGIIAAVLDAGGKAGHFGLIGMRERAVKLGAHLEVWSKPGAGTEIELRVPADVAYRKTRSREGRPWDPSAHSPATPP
jgi:signal transduction histidine kinase/ligand-binding sensor domain-containing protein